MRSKLLASYKQVKLCSENVENTGFFLPAGVKVSELSKLKVPEMMSRKGMMVALTAEVPGDGVRTCGRAELQKAPVRYGPAFPEGKDRLDGGRRA